MLQLAVRPMVTSRGVEPRAIGHMKKFPPGWQSLARARLQPATNECGPERCQRVWCNEDVRVPIARQRMLHEGGPLASAGGLEGLHEQRPQAPLREGHLPCDC